MAVSVRCSCGKLLDAEDSLRGQPVQCPHCSGVVLVPTATATWNTVDAAENQRKEAEGAVVGGIICIIIGLIVAIKVKLLWGLIWIVGGFTVMTKKKR